VHFKGSGFYTTDYGRNRTAAASDSGSDESKTEAQPKAAGSKPDSAGSGSDSGSSSSE
jgi:hypothetical protein